MFEEILRPRHIVVDRYKLTYGVPLRHAKPKRS